MKMLPLKTLESSTNLSFGSLRSRPKLVMPRLSSSHFNKARKAGQRPMLSAGSSPHGYRELREGGDERIDWTRHEELVAVSPALPRRPILKVRTILARVDLHLTLKPLRPFEILSSFSWALMVQHLLHFRHLVRQTLLRFKDLVTLDSKPLLEGILSSPLVALTALHLLILEEPFRHRPRHQSGQARQRLGRDLLHKKQEALLLVNRLCRHFQQGLIRMLVQSAISLRCNPRRRCTLQQDFKRSHGLVCHIKEVFFKVDTQLSSLR